MKRVIIFIDGSNFYFGLKRIYGDRRSLSKFNFLKFGKLLINEDKLVIINYYNAPLDYSDSREKYSKQQRFFDKIRKTENVKLILSRMQKRKIKGTDKYYYVVKGDDIHIAVDMVREAYEGAYDIAILVSGDGDFVPAIKTIKNKNKEIINAYFKQSMSWELKQNCDKSIRLSKEVLDKCFDD